MQEKTIPSKGNSAYKGPETRAQRQQASWTQLKHRDRQTVMAGKGVQGCCADHPKYFGFYSKEYRNRD
jgi:hypothetical protein